MTTEMKDLTQLAAETEADNRFQRAHPELKLIESVSRCVEAH